MWVLPQTRLRCNLSRWCVLTQLVHNNSSSLLQVRSQPARVIGTFLSHEVAWSQCPHSIIHRFVLATTQELHEKITELCSRVRDLEDALRVSHTQNSTKPHPLLTDELLRVKAPLQRESPPINPTTINQQEEENNPDVIDSFGTLAINRSGHTSYYGQFANSCVSRQFILHFSHRYSDSRLQTDSASYRFGNVICVVSRKLTLRFRTRWETSRRMTLVLMTFVTSFLPKYCSSVARFLSRRWSDHLQTR